MATPSDPLGEFLKAWLTARVGDKVGDRVFPDESDPSVGTPKINYFVVSEESPTQHQTGRGGTCVPSVQIDIRTRDRAQTDEIARAIVGTDEDPGLDALTGEHHGLRIQGARFRGKRNHTEPPVEGQGLSVRVASLDFTIAHWE